MIAHSVFDLLPPPAADLVVQQPTEPWLPILAAVGVAVVAALAFRRRRAARGKDQRA
jgi:MYXO-CTERM domain-containing protein